MNEIIVSLLNDEMYEDAKTLGLFITPLVSNTRIFSNLQLSAHYYNLAMAFQLSNCPSSAMKYFKLCEHSRLLSIINSKVLDGIIYNNTGSNSFDFNLSWNLYLCHRSMNEWQECVTVLNAIPSDRRSPKVERALAFCLQEVGDIQVAKNSLCQVLRAHPYSLETAKRLIQLQCPAQDVLKQMMLSMSKMPVRFKGLQQSVVYPQLVTFFECVLNLWGRVTAYPQIIESLKNLQTIQHDFVKNGTSNAPIQAYLAEAYYLSGDHEAAERCLKQLHTSHSEWVSHMDIYAYLLYRRRMQHLNLLTSLSIRISDLQKKSCKCAELSKLAAHLTTNFPNYVESWIAFGYVNLLLSQNIQHIITKVMHMDDRNPQVYLLHGQMYSMQEKYSEAITVYAEYRKFELCNMELLENSVQTYIKSKGYHEARIRLQEAIQNLGNIPRLLELKANVLFAENTAPTLAQAQSLYEQVLSKQPQNVESRLKLATILTRDSNEMKAIELLEEGIKVEKNSRLYMELSNIYLRCNEIHKAVECTQSALILDPQNEALKARLGALEGQLASNVLYMDEDGADTTGNWSD